MEAERNWEVWCGREKLGGRWWQREVRNGGLREIGKFGVAERSCEV